MYYYNNENEIEIVGKKTVEKMKKIIFCYLIIMIEQMCG